MISGLGLGSLIATYRSGARFQRSPPSRLLFMTGKLATIVRLHCNSLTKHAIRRHHVPSQPSNIVDIVAPLCDLLKGGGKWDALTARFSSSSVQLTDSLVQAVLFNLKEPSNANKALLFFHWSSKHHQLQHGLRSYCLAVHILVRAGLVVDARALLESAIRNNSPPGSPSDSAVTVVLDALLSTYDEVAPSGPLVFNLLLQSFAKLRMTQHAFDACCHLVERGFSISLMSFNTLLLAAQKSDSDIAWKVYEYMIERRVYPKQKTVEIMINVMCKQGILHKTLHVLDKIHGKRCAPMVTVNTALGFRILEADDRVERGILLLKRLLQKNMILDVVLYSLIIYARCKTGELGRAHEVHDEMLLRGCCSNGFVYTSFIGAHCKAGRIDEAIDLLQEMQVKGLKPYKETYDFLIEGSASKGRLEECLIFHEKMIEDGFIPDCVACNKMIGKLCEVREVNKANEILTLLVDKGFVPNEDTYIKLMDGVGNIENAQEVLKLYHEMVHSGINPSPMAYESLIGNLCRSGKLKEADKFLAVMEGKSGLAPTRCIYDVLISGHCKSGNTERAFFLYDDMISKRIQPSSYILEVLVHTMSEAGIIHQKINATVPEVFDVCEY